MKLIISKKEETNCIKIEKETQCCQELQSLAIEESKSLTNACI